MIDVTVEESDVMSPTEMASETKLNGELTCGIDPWSSLGESGFVCGATESLSVGAQLRRLARW